MPIELKNIFKKLPHINWKLITLHPFLLWLLFVQRIFEIYFNGKIKMPAAGTIAMIFVSFAVTFFIYLLIGILIKNKIKSSLISSLLISCLLFYGLIYNQIYHLIILKIQLLSFHANISSMIILSIIFIVIFAWVKKSKYEFIKLNGYLNVLFAILFLFNFSQLDFKGSYNVKLNNSFDDSKVKNVSTKPNIYYILVDAYTNPVSLKKYWGYDDTLLTNYLLRKEFFIGKNSRSNYITTMYSLTASLNMSYLSFDSSYFYSVYQIQSLGNLLNNSRAINYLKKEGYKFYNFSLFKVSHQKKYYNDIFFKKTTNLINGTFLAMLLNRIEENITPLYKTNLKIVSLVKKKAMEEDNSPFVIYAHLMMPHFWYYFKSNGQVVTDKKYITQTENMHEYLDQLKFTNKVLINMLDTIFRYSKTKPVIIIQGDHGARIVKGKGRDEESHSILNAYYFPDQDYSLLTEDENPVNSFRVVLKKYFNPAISLIKN